MVIMWVKMSANIVIFQLEITTLNQQFVFDNLREFIMKKIAADRNYRMFKRAYAPAPSPGYVQGTEYVVYGPILNRNSPGGMAGTYSNLEEAGVNLGVFAGKLEELAYGKWSDDLSAAVSASMESGN